MRKELPRELKLSDNPLANEAGQALWEMAKLLIECRDALPAISITSARLRGLDLRLADRVDEMLKPWAVSPDTPGAI